MRYPATLLILTALLPAFAFAQLVLPDNIFPDTTHAPFVRGVASGDPTPEAVIIWTHIEVDSASFGSSFDVDWAVATDSAMTNVVQNGTFATDSSRDFTVKIDVQGLQADTRYWYQFTQGGNTSAVGRTHTAPVGQVDALSFAVASCSSVFSGWFNAYRHIGRSEEIDLVVHVGDYIYEFVDDNEQIRVPEPMQERPENLRDWRWFHNYYHLDPDFRLALQRHPW
ncbi:MAG: alkaline phosphatase D family protein, partial [Bacteroidota bacterium]